MFSQAKNQENSDSRYDSQMNHNEVTSNRLKVDRTELVNSRFLARGLDFYKFLSPHKKAHSMLAGGHLSPFKGRGMDFDEVRPYQPGDDIRNIDWNVTARSSRVHTKIFKEERERPVFLIVDYRSTMHFATRGVLKSVQAAKLAALSAWTAADKHNRIGGIIFSDQFQIECRPVGGSKGVLRLINYLANSHQYASHSFQQEDQKKAQENQSDEFYQQPFSVKNLFERIRKIVKPGSLLIYISDFDYIHETNIKHLSYLSRHNDLINIKVYDPIEAELPPPAQYSVSQQTSMTSSKGIKDDDSADANFDFSILDTSNEQMRQTYHNQFVQHNDFLNHNSQKMGAYSLQVATNVLPKDALVEFFRQQQV
ncbi:MAG: DUF58 domain-containing protein [Gammaproteobacteria bacterium]|nr:DUF58 domain-containing protein [Gammaproteobacteria bacterium]